MTKFIRKQVGPHPKADLFRPNGSWDNFEDDLTDLLQHHHAEGWSYGWDGEDGGYRLVLNLWGMEAASDA